MFRFRKLLPKSEEKPKIEPPKLPVVLEITDVHRLRSTGGMVEFRIDLKGADGLMFYAFFGCLSNFEERVTKAFRSIKLARIKRNGAEAGKPGSMSGGQGT